MLQYFTTHSQADCAQRTHTSTLVGTQTEKGKIQTHAHKVCTERAPRIERQI